MPLDTLEKRPNIKNLSLETPAKSVRPMFEPETDITETQWQKVISEIREEKRGIDSKSLPNLYFYHTSYAKLLSPTRFRQIGVTEDDLSALQSDASSDPNITYLLARKVLAPDAHKAFYMDQEQVDNFFHRVDPNYLKPGAVARNFFEEAGMVEMAFPGRISTDPATFRRKEGIHGVLSWCKNRQNWREFAAQAASFRILFPNDFSDLKELDQSAWDSMTNYLKARDTSYPVDMALHLKMLAAEGLKITDQDIEIVMPKAEFSAQNYPIPSRRNF